MQRVYERCCGLDVHKKTVVACLLTGGTREIRTWNTMTADLLALIAWLQQHDCQQVAMESTGSYWKPIYNLLEAEGMPAMVVNAQHPQRVPGAALRPAEEAVPGRKTDVKDAEWIADLLRHGLLKPSFIPDRDQRELAEVVRYRRSLVEMRSAEINRIGKVLEGANIKLSSVLSNVVGVSGRAMLGRLVEGEEDPTALAALAHGTVRASQEDLARALQGMVGAHQRWLLQQQLSLIDELNQRIAAAEAEISRRLVQEEAVLMRLQTIPGVGPQTAQELIAIIGTDMSRFPTHRHLASWAKLCPGLHESGGRKAPTGIGPGHKLLRATLTEAARSLARSQTYLGAQYRRIAHRRGGKRAAIAVAHSILIIAYYLIRDGTTYQDLGPNYFDQRDQEKVIRRCTQRIEQLGKKVTITDAA
jgi:transposase